MELALVPNPEKKKIAITNIKEKKYLYILLITGYKRTLKGQS